MLFKIAVLKSFFRSGRLFFDIFLPLNRFYQMITFNKSMHAFINIAYI